MAKTKRAVETSVDEMSFRVFEANKYNKSFALQNKSSMKRSKRRQSQDYSRPTMDSMPTLMEEHSYPKMRSRRSADKMRQYLGKGFSRIEFKNQRMFLCESKHCLFESNEEIIMKTHIKSEHSRNANKSNQLMASDGMSDNEFLSEDYSKSLDYSSSDGQMTNTTKEVETNLNTEIETSFDSIPNSSTSYDQCLESNDKIDFNKYFKNITKIVTETTEDNTTNPIVICEEQKTVNVFHCFIIKDKSRELTEYELSKWYEKQIQSQNSKLKPNSKLRCRGFDGCDEEFDTYEEWLRHNKNHSCGRGIRQLDVSHKCSDLGLSDYYNLVFGNSGSYLIYECKVCEFVVKDLEIIRTHVHDLHIHPIEDQRKCVFAYQLAQKSCDLLGI